MIREVALPVAAEGVKKRTVCLIGYSGEIIRRYPCQPSTTNISLILKEGWGVHVIDDDVTIGVKLRDESCPTSEVPPTLPSGEPPVPDPVPLALEQMTGAEKLAAGYKPVPKDGRIVWEK